MSEIKREPVKIVVGEEEYEAFDDQHTLGDIARWISKNPVDAEELARLIDEQLALTPAPPAHPYPTDYGQHLKAGGE